MEIVQSGDKGGKFLKDQLLHANGLRLHLADWGQHEKPPLMLLHGLASTLHMFDLLAPALAQRFHVRAFDQRGHGGSEGPDTGYDFESVASDLDAVLDHLMIERTALAGHSWGAYTALYYAATRPQRVARCVLIDGGVIALRERWPTWEEAETGMSPPRHERRSLDDVRRMIREDWLGAAFRPELEALALSIFDVSDPQDVQPRLKRARHMQIAHAAWQFDPVAACKKVSAPTLIVNAASTDADWRALQERATQKALDALAAGRAVWMEHTIHDIPWQRPRELAAIMMEFLS